MSGKLIKFGIIVFFTFSVFQACKKDEDPFPETLSDQTQISDILDISAVAKSYTSQTVPGTVVQYGHVWVSSDVSAADPTTSNSKTQLAGKAPALPDTIKSTLFPLIAGKTYKVRSYIETSSGVVYGSTQTFTTDTDYIKRLTKIIGDSLKDKGFGYSFVITKKDKVVGSGAGGFQSRAIEVIGEKVVTLNSKMEIASMTKTITAMAFLKLAQEKGIKSSDLIIKYLPASWVKGKGIEKIRFADLMTHRSGIIGLGDYCQNGAYGENNWYGLRSLIAKGIKAENYGNQCYQNANFGMFRVLIPSIAGYKFAGDDVTDDEQTIKLYEKYVRENVLSKAGITSPAVLYNPVESPTYGYDYPYTAGSSGFDPGDFSSTTGAYGFYLTANEAASLYAKVFSTDDQTIISSALKDTLLINGFGNYSAVTPQGKFSYHDGWWYITYGNGYFQGFRSVWMKCPDDITIVLFTNSLRHGDGLFPIFADTYSDITSYLLWTFSELYNPARGGRLEKRVNFHDYLTNPEPH